MVSPVNSDKPLAPSTERSVESRGNTRPQQTTVQPGTSGQQSDKPTAATVEVDTARQLYNLENQLNRTEDVAVDTPEEARSLLDRIVEQFSGSPETALKTHADNASAPLANLLQKAPA